MKKIVLISGGVLLAVALVVFIFPMRGFDAPHLAASPMSQLLDAAERMCLSNTADSKSAQLGVKLAEIKSGIEASANIEKRHAAERGAAQRFNDEIAKLESDDIRQCMIPWGDKVRALSDQVK